jgi:hypothetical protein
MKPFKPTPNKQSFAAHLLAKLLQTDSFSARQLAAELVIPEDALTKYADGESEMPLERQLCLATFIIEKVPPLVRHGYRLRAQVAASLTYHTRATITHSTSPPGWPR